MTTVPIVGGCPKLHDPPASYGSEKRHERRRRRRPPAAATLIVAVATTTMGVFAGSFAGGPVLVATFGLLWGLALAALAARLSRTARWRPPLANGSLLLAGLVAGEPVRLRSAGPVAAQPATGHLAPGRRHPHPTTAMRAWSYLYFVPRIFDW